MCDPDNRQCAITTRVNVMLRDVPALGQWLLVSKGYHAAVTLPPAAELLAQAGGYVAGWLGMEEKLVHRRDRARPGSWCRPSTWRSPRPR
jgi:hypothetical protein